MGNHSAKAKKAGRMLLLLLVMCWGLAGGCAKEAGLADIPEYAPTRPFLEEQERLRQRAIAIREFRRRERAKYAAKGLEASLAAWQPIVDRIVVAREAKPERERQRRAVLARAQAERIAQVRPIFDRNPTARERGREQERQQRALLARARDERISGLRPIFDLNPTTGEIGREQERQRRATLAREQQERVARLQPLFDRIRAEEEARARRKREETNRRRTSGAPRGGAGTRRTAP